MLLTRGVMSDEVPGCHRRWAVCQVARSEAGWLAGWLKEKRACYDGTTCVCGGLNRLQRLHVADCDMALRSNMDHLFDLEEGFYAVADCAFGRKTQQERDACALFHSGSRPPYFNAGFFVMTPRHGKPHTASAACLPSIRPTICLSVAKRQLPQSLTCNAALERSVSRFREC
jgi:hypothetical protein